MQRIDSLFAPKNIGVRPTPQIPILNILKKKEEKKIKKNIYFKKCKSIFNNGICIKGDNCHDLHLNSGQEYKNLLACFVNKISNNADKNNIADILESVDQMHSGLPIFKKFVYRKNEGCIFESLTPESSLN